MGCASSSADGSSAPGNAIPEGWVVVTLDTTTGDIMRQAAENGVVNANGEGEILAKCTLGKRVACVPGVRKHFVQDKVGGTWDETMLNGQMTFSCLNQSEMDELWKSVGTSAPEENSLKTCPKGAKSWLAYGKAEWKDKVSEKTFVVAGMINDTVNIIEKETGLVVLTLHQDSMGKKVKFYNGLVAKKGSSVEKECGMRMLFANDFQATNTPYISLALQPEVLEKLPISLFAFAVLYSSFDCSGMEC